MLSVSFPHKEKHKGCLLHKDSPRTGTLTGRFSKKKTLTGPTKTSPALKSEMTRAQFQPTCSQVDYKQAYGEFERITENKKEISQLHKQLTIVRQATQKTTTVIQGNREAWHNGIINPKYKQKNRVTKKIEQENIRKKGILLLPASLVLLLQSVDALLTNCGSSRPNESRVSGDRYRA